MFLMMINIPRGFCYKKRDSDVLNWAGAVCIVCFTSLQANKIGIGSGMDSAVLLIR